MRNILTGVLAIAAVSAFAERTDITAAVRAAGKASFSMAAGEAYAKVGETYGPDCAFDGDTTSLGSRALFNTIPSDATPVILQYDIAPDFNPDYEVVVESFTVYQLYTGYGMLERSPTVFELLGSADGVTWKSLFAIDPNSPETVWRDPATSHTYVIPVANRGDYRHYRFKVTKNNGWTSDRTGLGYHELAFFGYFGRPVAPRRAVRARSSVYDDAAYWIRGAVDKNGNGILDQGELVETYHAGEPDHPLNQGYAYTYNPSAIQIKKMTVAAPYAYRELPNQSCIYFQQGYDASKGTYFPGCIRLPNLFPVTNNYTVVTRVYLEGFMPSSIRSGVFFLGNAWAPADEGGSRGYPCYFRGQWNGFQFYNGISTDGPTGDDTLCTGGWFDIAVVVSGTGVTYYTCRMNRALCVTESPNAWHETLGKNARDDFWLGYNDRLSGPTSDTSKLDGFFRGYYHHFAIWDRVLTKKEVEEAFGWPGEDLVRYGVVDGGSSEFAGKGLVVTNNAENGWYDLPATLTADRPSVTVRFRTKSSTVYDLPQVLRISASDNSAPVSLSVTLNGQGVGTRLAYPGETAYFRLGKDLFTGDENELTVTCLNPGGEPYRFDALALGGGWQLGIKDDSFSEFSVGDPDYYVHDGHTYHMRRALNGQPGNTQTNAFIHVFVPGDMAANTRFTLKTRIRRIGLAKLLAIAFNGVVRQTVELPASGTWTDVEAVTDYGELVPGENVIRLSNVSIEKSEDSWMEIDYVRFEPRARSGEGATILVR